MIKKRPPRQLSDIQLELRAEPFSHRKCDTTAEFVGHAPTVFLEGGALRRIWHLVALVPQEVGWLGSVIRRSSGDFVIKEIFLFPQIVGVSTTTILSHGLAEIGTRLIGERPDGIDTVNSIQYWGHSHANFSAVPSRQDNEQMAELADCGHTWFLRGICNKRGDMRFDVFFFEAGVVISDMPWSVIEKEDAVMRAEVTADVKANVRVVSTQRVRRPRPDRVYPDIESSVPTAVNADIANSVGRDQLPTTVPAALSSSAKAWIVPVITPNNGTKE